MLLALLLPYRHSLLQQKKYQTLTRRQCQKSPQSLRKIQVWTEQRLSDAPFVRVQCTTCVTPSGVNRPLTVNKSKIFWKQTSTLLCVGLLVSDWFKQEKKERTKERTQLNTVRELLAPPVLGVWWQRSHFFEIGHLWHVRRVSLQNKTSTAGQRENKLFISTLMGHEWRMSVAPPTLLWGM